MLVNLGNSAAFVLPTNTFQSEECLFPSCFILKNEDAIGDDEMLFVPKEESNFGMSPFSGEFPMVRALMLKVV